MSNLAIGLLMSQGVPKPEGGGKVALDFCAGGPSAIGLVMADFVAFLRGINVGGKNRLKMARLVELFEQAGAVEVSTYIQSGNVLFSLGRGALSEAQAQAVAEEVGRALKKEDHLVVPITVRKKTALSSALAAHPFAAQEADERMVGIGFLSDRPAPAAVKKLDPERSPGDRFFVKGREVFLHTPNGSARSKLTVDYFDRALGLTMTVRNLKTVRALVELD